MMKSKTKNRITAMLIVSSILGGVLLGSGISSTINENRRKAYAFEESNDGLTVGYCEGIQNALFPMHQDTIITQTAFEEYSHSGYDEYRGRFFESNAMDIQNWTDTYMYAPFTGTIVDFNPSCNCFAFQSKEKVRFSNGVLDYMTVYVLHSEQRDTIQYYYQTGEVIEQGSKMIEQGGSNGDNDDAYPKHLDVQVRTGKNCGIDEDVKLNGDTFAFSAFFKGNETSFCTYTDRRSISNGSYESYAGQWEEDPYNGNWASADSDVFTPIDTTHSILKVYCSNELAFAGDYSIWDVLIGDELHDQATKLATIQNVVNNYPKLEIEGLSDFEREVYDSCSYEWVSSIPDSNEIEYSNEPIANTSPEMIKITFVTNEDEYCEESIREISWGTCTYDFPTPQKINANFIGWVDDSSGNIITCDSLLTEDITLHALFDDMNADKESDNPDVVLEVDIDAQKYNSPLYKNDEIPNENEIETSTETICNIKGDVTGDKILDARDATSILTLYAKISAGEYEITDEMLKIADANGDDLVNIIDSQLILEFYTISSSDSFENITFEEYIKSKN